MMSFSQKQHKENLEKWSSSKFALFRKNHKFGFQLPTNQYDFADTNEASVVIPYRGELWIATNRGGGLFTLNSDFVLEKQLDYKDRDAHGDKHLGAYHEPTDKLLIGKFAVDKGDIKEYSTPTGASLIDAREEDDQHMLAVDFWGRIYRVDMTTHPPSATQISTVPKPVDTNNESEVRECSLYNGYLIVPAEDGKNHGLFYYDVSADTWTTVTTNGFYTGVLRHKDYVAVFGTDAKSDIIWTTEDGTTYSMFRLPRVHTHQTNYHPCEFRRSQILQDRGLVNMRGMWFELPLYRSRSKFPNSFDPLPICRDMWEIGDLSLYQGFLAIAHREGTKTVFEWNDSGGTPQSGVSLVSLQYLEQLGEPRGKGGVWNGDSVGAGETSDPFLINGFDKKTIHLETDAATDYTIQVDPIGDGSWKDYDTVSFSGAGYDTYIMTGDAVWVRVKSSDAVTATAWFNVR